MATQRHPAEAASQPEPWSNPAGTDGFEFVEYTAPDPAALGALFERLGFEAVARHRSKDVTLYRQGDVNFIVNAEPDSFAQSFARVHGPAPAPWPSASRTRPRLTRARWRWARGAHRRHDRADGAQHPGDRGHRRQPDLSRRPLRAGQSIYDVDFVP